MMSKEIRLPVRGHFSTMNIATIEEFQMAMENNFAMFAFQVNIQYNTISNWVNLAKGEHNCQFCGRTFPWKAVLEKHIKKHHKVQTKMLKADIKIAFVNKVSGWRGR